MKDTQMRPYANMFLLSLAQCLDHLPNLQKRIVELVDIHKEDVKVCVAPDDCLPKTKDQVTFAHHAPKWSKRILSLSQLTFLVR